MPVPTVPASLLFSFCFLFFFILLRGIGTRCAVRRVPSFVCQSIRVGVWWIMSISGMRGGLEESAFVCFIACFFRHRSYVEVGGLICVGTTEREKRVVGGGKVKAIPEYSKRS